MSLEKEGAWKDVVAKAKRILDSGGVTVESYSPYEIHCTVIGDTNVYSTSVYRKNAFGKGITWFDCECLWGHHTYQTISYAPYVERPCSHCLAVFWTAQSLDAAYKKLEKSSMKQSDLTEDLQEALGGSLDSELDQEDQEDVEGALGTDEAISGDPVVDEFIEWIAACGYLVDELPKSTVVSLAVEYVEEAYQSGNDIDIEDLTKRVFGHYFYDPESDPTRMSDQEELENIEKQLDQELGDTVTDAVSQGVQQQLQKVLTPVGEGIIHEANSSDGMRFLRVAGTDNSGHPFDTWFLAQEVELVSPTGMKSSAARTAGRNYTQAEQQALLDEGEGEISDYRKSLNLEGTHYLDYNEPVWF